MLAGLRTRSAPYVIYRHDFFQDGVIYDVRDPLIFRG